MDYLMGLGVASLLTLAGLSIGLYLGERGRRQALERQVTYGSTLPLRASVGQPAPEPEARLEQLGRVRGRGDELGVSESTIKRGTKAIQAMAKAGGHAITEEEARRQVEAMLHPDAAHELGDVELPL